MGSSDFDKDIIFTLIYNGKEYPVQTKKNEYLSLMSLISDHLNISGFGLCCGMRSCETCIVEMDEESAMSCDIAVNDHLANTRIFVKESRY